MNINGIAEQQLAGGGKRERKGGRKHDISILYVYIKRS
jgi:hypothetical protein